jgi:hypothetical protein
VTGAEAAQPAPVVIRPPAPTGALRHVIVLPPLVKIGIGVVALVAVGLAIKLIASPGQPPRCVFTCSSPPIGPIQPVGATFTSPQWGFSFDYPKGLRQFRVSGTGVAAFGWGQNARAGQIMVAAGTDSTSLTGLVDGYGIQLANSVISNAKDLGPMNGAEIGFIPGEGEFFSGDFTDPQQNVYPVAYGIAAVRHNNAWVMVAGVSAESSSDNSPVLFGDFDDILDRWRWTP